MDFYLISVRQFDLRVLQDAVEELDERFFESSLRVCVMILTFAATLLILERHELEGTTIIAQL